LSEEKTLKRILSEPIGRGWGGCLLAKVHARGTVGEGFQSKVA
jgi:hypothetical protein